MAQDTTGNPFNFKVAHDVAQLNNVIGYPTKIWRATKKYSVNNTLPTVAVSTWIQFSLAYVAAVMITHNNLSYITDVFNSQLMPAYALASVILGTILLTSLVIKYIHTQEIKDEKSQNGDSPIDIKIRGGESDGINEIAQNASVIEIVPDLSGVVDKKQGFSIAFPISGKQGEILENKRQENRNKVILLTVPYILSSLIIAGALAKFGFIHVRGWKEWASIAVLGIITIVGICITLNKLRNNEVDNIHNAVKKFNNIDILLPCRKGSVVSVMENKFESKEENDLQSQALKLFERFLTGFKDDVCHTLDKQLTEANRLFKENLLDPSNKKIQEALNHLKEIREDIKKDLDWLHAAILQILNNGKELTEDVNSPSVADIIKEMHSKLKALSFRGLIDFLRPNNGGQCGNGNEFPAMVKKYKDKVEKLQNEVKELKKQMEGLKNKQTQPSEPETSSTTSNDSHQDEKKRLEEENKSLKEQEYIEKLRKENAKLKESLSPEVKERKEKINGKPSEFLYYILESIKLGEKATLRNFDNKIIIHWKDGSQTICYIEKQGDLPSTKVDFVDKNIQAAFAAACVG